MSKKIVIFGDSHTRSFAYINNIYPVFLGAGLQINLHDKSINRVINTITQVKNKLKNKLKNYENVVYCTMLGEPDVRYQLNNDWYVHSSNFKYKGKINYKYLDLCVKNQKKIMEELPFIDYIITPTTSYEPSLDSLNYFNSELKNTFKDKVIDVYSKTIDTNGKIIKEFIGSDENEKNPDPIHLNSCLGDLFIEEIINKTIINKEEKQFYDRFKYDKFNSKDLRSMFISNRFGTLKLN